MSRLKLLLVSPHCDLTDVGEAHFSALWADRLSRQADVTLLTQARPGRPDAARQLPFARVISFPDLALPKRLERFNAMLKPGYPLFAARVRQWLRVNGRAFDLAHQLSPIAMRYASPLARAGLPYVLGPVGGTLETPPGFAAECGSASLFTRLRALDGWRLAHDPWLRETYRNAACVLGIGPYVAERLAPVGIRDFAVMSELAIDDLAPPRAPRDPARPLRLLHVGRAVRTKGLRDCVRAMARLSHLPGLTLDQVGGGEELDICRREAEALGLAGRIRFHGPLPRGEIEALYAAADVFLFPSFREPSGGVIFEAMRHSLPVITSTLGGPGYLVDDSCGLRIHPREPAQFACDIAAAVESLWQDRNRLSRLSQGARARVAELGLWGGKLSRVFTLYEKILSGRAGERIAA